MTLFSLKELDYLKNSSALLQKIEEIQTALHNMNCTTNISPPAHIEDNIMRLELKICFPVN